MSNKHGYEVGETCGRRHEDGSVCEGIISDRIQDDMDFDGYCCSCHISAPCGYCCHDEELYCPECDWEPEPEPEPEPEYKPTAYVHNYGYKKKTIDDLDKDSFSYLVGSTGYYGMTYNGYFPKGWGRDEILANFNTCFGYRFEMFNEKERRFKLVVYTD